MFRSVAVTLALCLVAVTAQAAGVVYGWSAYGVVRGYDPITGNEVRTINTSLSSVGLTYGGLSAPAVPIPPAVWLFGSALGLMGMMRRKISG